MSTYAAALPSSPKIQQHPTHSSNMAAATSCVPGSDTENWPALPSKQNTVVKIPQATVQPTGEIQTPKDPVSFYHEQVCPLFKSKLRGSTTFSGPYSDPIYPEDGCTYSIIYQLWEDDGTENPRVFSSSFEFGESQHYLVEDLILFEHKTSDERKVISEKYRQKTLECVWFDHRREIEEKYGDIRSAYKYGLLN